VLSDWTVFKDPPDHSRLRNLVKRAFTPRAVQALTGQIESVVDPVLDRPASGEVDVIAAMLGVPPEDRDLFRGWSNEVSTLIFEGERTDDGRARAQDGLVLLSEHLGGLMEVHRKHSGDDLSRPSSRCTTAVKR
jgi:cytochrome P450